MRNELNASKVGVDTFSFKNIVYVLVLGQKNNVDVTPKVEEQNVFHLGGQKNFFVCSNLVEMLWLFLMSSNPALVRKTL